MGHSLTRLCGCERKNTQVLVIQRWCGNGHQASVVASSRQGVKESLASSRYWHVSPAPWVSFLSIPTYLQNMYPLEIVQDLACVIGGVAGWRWRLGRECGWESKNW